jgi:membrane protease YdiL (CAAX protease family)
MEQNFVKRGSMFVQVAKLVAYFLIYQFVFMMLGQVGAYFAYSQYVEPVAYEAFREQPTTQMLEYAAGGMSVGMFLSGVAMIAHLLFFKYVRIRRGFFSEVGRGVLFLSIAFIMCMMVVFNIVAVWLGLENNLQSEMELMLGSRVGVASVAFVAPLLEELLFRGAIQGALMRYFKSPWVGIVLAALLFGVIHLNPIQVFYATCLGIVFGWVYYRTGSLLPAILGHIINNSLAVISMVVLGESNELEMVTGETGVTGEAFMVVSFALVALLLGLLINSRQPSAPSPWHEVSEAI